MANLLKSRSFYLHATRVYLIAIVLLTLVLLAFTLTSLERQRKTIKELSVANLQLHGERLAVELERHAWQLAEDCLRDPELRQLGSTLSETTENIPGAQLQLSAIAKRHSIARHFFVWRGGEVRSPRLKNPPPHHVNFKTMSAESGPGAQFAELFKDGEDEELNQGRPETGLPLYLQSYELPVAEEWKALALARAARCLVKLKKPTDAIRAYHELKDRYGDQYDEQHFPYGLTAMVEIDAQTGQNQPALLEPLLGIYRDLNNGRWELSAEQIEHFQSSLEQRLGARAGARPKTRFLEKLTLARAVDEGLPLHMPFTAGRVYSQAISAGDVLFQTYHVLLRTANGEEVILGFSLDLDWLVRELLPRCKLELEKHENFVAFFGIALGKTEPGSQTDAHSDELYIPFKTVLPFWELRVPGALTQASKTAARREMVLVGGSAVMMLCVLSLGVFLLVRVSRELQRIQLRNDFVSGVSHELRTPMTLIQVCGETLLSNGDLTWEERERCYQVITRESKRLGHLIDNLLDFSSVERGQEHYRFIEGDLAPVVIRTVEAYGQWLTQHGFSILTDIAPFSLTVRFDPEKISQAVLNMIDNARKYCGSSRSVWVRLWSDKSRIVLEIEDHGIGIPAEDHERIFEQFYRGHKDPAGCGLGLFLVRRIMDAHEGSIDLESEIGRGSRFRLIFPVSQLVSEGQTETALQSTRPGVFTTKGTVCTRS